MKILVLNSGSSSQKGRLYQVEKVLPDIPPVPLWKADVEWSDRPAETTIERTLETLWAGTARVIDSPSDIDVVGHRVVHGGTEYEKPVIVTPEVKASIARLSVFAPLHNRAELEGIEIVERIVGTVPQVAVFDTSFHRHLPPAAAVYPGPYEWLAQGIRRYGFHGINHQYCAERAAQLLGPGPRTSKLVICHLGNGCSLAAVRDGRSVDTTMGFTPLDGLMMGTRPGSLDPGILTYLLRQGQLTGQQLDDVLNTKSGLLGISGVSGDMRRILAALREGHQRAKLAFDIYVHRLQCGIGAMIAVLGGLDGLVFTAGIGENAPEVRAAACANLEFLGLTLDPEMNAQSPADQDIARPDSTARVLIIRAGEDWAIARACLSLVSKRAAAPDCT